MELNRKPLQGVLNIIRFNWHLYVMAIVFLVGLLIIKNYFPNNIRLLFDISIIGIGITIFTSLLTSFYIYDVSDLYQFKWIKMNGANKILNIHAGFDETSDLLAKKIPNAEIVICDFYNSKIHTEISIKRARKKFPPKSNTISVPTDKLPFDNTIFDHTFVIFSAHEIRNDKERVVFFSELKRVTKGQIVVMEHLRDFNNFIAYTVGFFHFYPQKKWINTFHDANLRVKDTFKVTPFITTYILE